MQERYDTVKRYSMELISMDLAHERELKDLNRRMLNLENQFSARSDAGSGYNESKEEKYKSYNSTSHPKLEDGDNTFEDTLEFKFTNISKAMKKLNASLKTSESKLNKKIAD